jgi:UDP-glucose/GDP-mannose dehydrogenase family protein
MKISVIGAGYVGLTTAACLAQIGHDVFCSENDKEKLANLQAGVMPLFEPHLERMIAHAKDAGQLTFGSTDEVIDRGKAIFICVGTPPLGNGDADLSGIEGVARAIAKKASGYRLVIEKSTVPVQTGAQLRKHLAVHSTNGLDYDVASNPEFLREVPLQFRSPSDCWLRARRFVRTIRKPWRKRRFCFRRLPTATMLTKRLKAPMQFCFSQNGKSSERWIGAGLQRWLRGP